jgi:hypothetical protein
VIVTFAESPRTTFEEVRKNRPAPEKVKIALAGFLENVKFKNCRINRGYIRALGMQDLSASQRSLRLSGFKEAPLNLTAETQRTQR